MSARVGAAERARLLGYGRGASAAYERDASVVDVFEGVVARTPDAVAVVADGAAISYRELDARANRFANHLVALGAEPACTVGVAIDRSIDLPVVLLGILKAGAAYVALDASYPSERLEHILHDATIEFVVTRGPLCDPGLLARITTIDLIDDAARIAARSAVAPRVGAGAEAVAYVAYTSGSTGRAKGVTIVNRGVVRLVRGTDYVDIVSDDVFLHFAPLSFDASTFEIWAPLLNGARLAIAPAGTLSLGELGRVLERFGVTTLWLTAPLFRLMVVSELAHLGGLRQLLTGGDVVSPDAATRFLEAFPRCRLIDGYGPTENTTFSCCYHVSSPESIRGGVPIGRPIANSTAYVVDESMQLVPFGAAGELCVGGDGLATGYLNLPELTAERFVADPFSEDPNARLYRTGDVARFRADGALEFLGRLDHQVKIRGFRVELAEIESVLRGHAAIAEAAVSVVTLAGEKTLFAHVVFAPDAVAEERDIRSYLGRKLPKHMIPAYVEIGDGLPAHPSGKLDRVRLAEIATARACAAKPVGARNGLERSARLHTVVTCWRDVLGVSDAPEMDANFFDAGGDSLRLLALHARLQRELHIEFGIVELFEHCTIRKLAAFVNARVA